MNSIFIFKAESSSFLSCRPDQVSLKLEMWVRRLDQGNIDSFENLSEFGLILIQLDGSPALILFCTLLFQKDI